MLIDLKGINKTYDNGQPLHVLKGIDLAIERGEFVSIMGKLMTLPGDTDVLPGHGHPTSIARESASNPFLLPFNEPDTAWWNQEGISLDGD